MQAMIVQHTGQPPQQGGSHSEVATVAKPGPPSSAWPSQAQQASASCPSSPHPFLDSAFQQASSRGSPSLTFIVQMEKAQCQAQHQALSSSLRTVPGWQRDIPQGRSLDSLWPSRGPSATRISAWIPAEEQLQGGWFPEAAGPGWCLCGSLSHFHSEINKWPFHGALSVPFLPDLTTIPCSEARSQNSLLHSIIQQTSVSYSGVHSALTVCVRKNSVLLLFKPCNYLTKTSMGMNK